MATITFTITTAADGTMSKTYTVSEADIATWFSALKASRRAPGISDAAAALAWANSVIQDQIGLAMNYQIRQATNSLTPISIT